MRGRRAALVPLLAALAAPAAVAQPAPRIARPPPAVRPPEAPGPEEPEPRPTVASVDLRLPPGTQMPPDVVMGVKVGQRLSAREVRRSMVRLYETGLFSTVQARTSPAPGGVRVTFEMTPRATVKGISVRGNRALTEGAVLNAAGLGPKSEVTDTILQAAMKKVEESYRQHGYDQANASAEVTGGKLSMTVVVTVVEGAPTRLQQVSVTGDPGMPLERIMRATSLSVGGVLDRAAMTEGLEQLRGELRGARHYRAHIGEPIIALTAPWAVVSLPIEAGPRYLIHFHQNHQIADGVLKAVLDYDGSEALDTPVSARLARRLTAYYQARGWFDVQVKPREMISRDGKEALLTFNIEEGPRLRVTDLTFEGNRVLSTGELLDQVRLAVQRQEPIPAGARTFDSLQLEGRSERPGIPEVPPLDPEKVYSEDAYREAADAITEMYRNRGFLSARVRFAEARIDPRSRNAQVRFTVEEGPRTRVASIGVEGLPPEVDVPVSAQPLQKGDPLNISLLERGRKELLGRLAREGYLYARVDPDTRISGDASLGDIVYRVDSGPQVRVGQVSLRGAERSDRRVVLANIPLKPGDVLNPERLLDSQRTLANLGGYRQVAVRLDQPDLAEPQKDVKVELIERPLTEGEVGLGFSAQDGPRLLLDGSYPNMLGQAINLEARGKVHWIGAGQSLFGAFGLQSQDRCDWSQPSAWYGIGGKTTVSLRAPRVRYFLPASIGAHVDLVGEREFRPSFQFATLAGIVGMDWTISNLLIASLQYNLELDRVCTYQLRGEPFNCGAGGLADLVSGQERRFFSFGSFLLHSVAPSIAVDLRDDPANPTFGLIASGSAEVTSSLRADYPLLGVKAQGTITGYLPLARRVVLAASIRGGRFYPLAAGNPLPAPKRYYLGGFTTLRGFSEDGLLPEDSRISLGADRRSCAALVNRTGCTKSALALLGGVQLTSEGGEMFALARGELRFPFVGPVDLGVFIEAGNLWSDTSTPVDFSLRPVGGAGIRYETPIGPLALDVGFNLLPDLQVNEQTFNFHFNIGLF